MPQNKKEKLIFGSLMGLVMVYGMETYNHILVKGQIDVSVLMISVVELIFLTVIVNVIELLFGGRIARTFAFKFVDPEKDKPLKVILTVSVMTVCIMCPAMSLVATCLFKLNQGNFVIVWLSTVLINFPMALCWQLFVAGPLVRTIFKKICGTV